MENIVKETTKNVEKLINNLELVNIEKIYDYFNNELINLCNETYNINTDKTKIIKKVEIARISLFALISAIGEVYIIDSKELCLLNNLMDEYYELQDTILEMI